MEISLTHSLQWSAQWKFCVCTTCWMLLSTPTTNHHIDGVGRRGVTDFPHKIPNRVSSPSSGHPSVHLQRVREHGEQWGNSWYRHGGRGFHRSYVRDDRRDSCSFDPGNWVFLSWYSEDGHSSEIGSSFAPIEDLLHRDDRVKSRLDHEMNEGNCLESVLTY